MKKYSAFCLLLFSLLAFSLESFGRERDRHFKKGRGSHFRGNERSERPGRVPIGRPTWGGNGCPAGTMNVVFAPDNLSFSILFDQFVAETESGRGPRRDVMTCDALIPIEIPANMQMEITRVDYRGFIGLPARAQARLHAMFNFRGRGGDGDRLNLRFDFQGPVMDNYEISTDLIDNNTEISPCGGSTVLRVYNQLQVVSRTPGQAAQATIDSIDGQSNAVYHLNWRACGAKKGDDGRGGRNDRDNGRGGRSPGRR